MIFVDEKGQTCTKQPRVVRFNFIGVPSQQVKVLFLKGGIYRSVKENIRSLNVELPSAKKSGDAQIFSLIRPPYRPEVRTGKLGQYGRHWDLPKN